MNSTLATILMAPLVLASVVSLTISYTVAYAVWRLDFWVNKKPTSRREFHDFIRGNLNDMEW